MAATDWRWPGNGQATKGLIDGEKKPKGKKDKKLKN